MPQQDVRERHHLDSLLVPDRLRPLAGAGVVGGFVTDQDKIDKALAELAVAKLAIGRAETALHGIPLPEPEPEEPEPPVEPEPEPPVDPQPPVEPGEKPADIYRLIDPERLVTFPQWTNDERYDRWQELVVWSGETATVEFYARRSGSRSRPFLGTEYTLTLDDEPLATVPVTGGRASTEISIAGFSGGWHVLDVICPYGETSTPIPVWIAREGTPPPAHIPVWTESYESGQLNRPHYHIKWVPADGKPIPAPLERRECPHFSDAKSRIDLFREMIVPGRTGSDRRFNVSKEGILNTAGRHWYTYADAMRKIPRQPLLDGPRGVGSLGFTTHIEIGTANCDMTGPVENVYVLDPWRVAKIRPNGEIVTLVGYRHPFPHSYWRDPSNVELVGDWSAIPESRRGFHELWGWAWNRKSLKVDANAPRIPEEKNLKPHLVAPKAVVTDTQNNRLCGIEFNSHAHGLPPKVTEFATDIHDAWDVVPWGEDEYLVSERGKHRIIALDVETGAYKRTIIEGSALSEVDSNRFVRRLASLEAIRSQPCVGPEGLYVRGEWLYFGSIAMAQVRRLNLVTGVLEVVSGNYTFPQNSLHYIKLAVSDGTFGPEHTVFATWWGADQAGGPVAFLPGGTRWTIMQPGSAAISRGAGGVWDSAGYNGGIAVADGRLYYGGSMEGLPRLSARLPSDPSVSSRYRAGRDEYIAKGYHLTHGDNAFGHYGLPIPWGESEDMDYYLEVVRHGR